MAKKKKTITEMDEKKRNWMLAGLALLGATTITGTTLAIYYGVHRFDHAAVIHTVTLDLDGGTIQGKTTYEVDVLDGTIVANLPSPVKDNHYFSHWEQDGKTVSPTTPIVGNMTLKAKYDDAQESLVITGADTLIASQTSKYTAKIESAATVDIEWTLTYTGTGKAPTINKTTGELTTYDDATKQIITITATDKISTKTATKIVTVSQPTDNSTDMWTLVSGNWLKLTISDLTDSSKLAIGTQTLSGVTGSIDKSNFTTNVIAIGDDIVAIPDNLCIGMNKFNGSIKFTNTSKCTVIGKCFMQDCASYNSKLELPNSVVFIDDGFLVGCSAFNNGSDTVGTFKMPTSLTTIGSYFLNECVAFNHDIVIAETVKKVGADFMANCDSFCSKLTVNTDAENFDATAPVSLTLTTTDSTKAIYQTGVLIDGTFKNEFRALFPDRNPSETITTAFRHLRNS